MNQEKPVRQDPPTPTLQTPGGPDLQPRAEAEKLPPDIAWERLAAGSRLVVIRFKDKIYQLRETRNGKLILTK